MSERPKLNWQPIIDGLGGILAVVAVALAKSWPLVMLFLMVLLMLRCVPHPLP